MRRIEPDRWRQAGALFHELVELDEPSRSGRLSQLGASDPELRATVEALLAGDANADRVLPAPGFGLGAIGGCEREDTLGLAGATIGRFRVLEQIAWGGMGVVYRAEDMELHRPVALKFPLLDSGVPDSARALTLREARAAGALDHPNLCPIYDVGESDAGPFFVMPLYGGETLKARLSRTAPLAVADALSILEQLAAGLACAHAAGIIHCDIKPGNVMLLPDGTVKVFDFGLARAVADSWATAGVVGTVHYMAPEQIRNESVDARADLWALGVILYEMLHGSRPFIGDDADAIIHSVLESQPKPLGASVVRVPSAVHELVNALLEKDPGVRFQTAAQLTRAIAAARTKTSRRGSVALTKRRFILTGGILTMIGVLASALWLRSPVTLMRSGKLSPHDTLVLADFEIAGLDPSNAPALTTILRRDFADSKAVSLMPSSNVASALERMRQRPGAPITPELAREIGRREGARAVVSGRVSPLASGYLVTLRLFESETGSELASSAIRAASAERDLLPALAEASQAIRRAIGESPRDARLAASRNRKPLTTTSLEAARLMWGWNSPAPPVADRIAAARASIRIDSAFAYAWMSIGIMLSWTNYRSAAHDSALVMAYRFRDNVTFMERAQVSASYWGNVQSDRRNALTELGSALALDSTVFRVVPLNIAGLLIATRQFEQAEAFARRIEGWTTVGSSAADALVRSQVAQGKYAAAESTISRERSNLKPNDARSLALERVIALGALRFDSAEVLLAGTPESDVALGEKAAIERLRGRLLEAHRLAERRDSMSAAIAAAAGARFDPVSGRALARSREALWIERDPTAAVAYLDERWRTTTGIHDIQDRIDGIKAAAMYAAAGRPVKARMLLTTFENGADTIARRAIYEYRQLALGEVALADGKFTEAMRLFRASDLGADGLAASPCSVCGLPNLARVAERAGWPDSARVFWNAYVTRPAIDRVWTDQWFLATAYFRLAAFAAIRGDSMTALAYRAKLAELRGSVSKGAKQR